MAARRFSKRRKLIIKTFGSRSLYRFGYSKRAHAGRTNTSSAALFVWHIDKSFPVATYRYHWVQHCFGHSMVCVRVRVRVVRRCVCEWKEYKSICHAINENSINKFSFDDDDVAESQSHTHRWRFVPRMGKQKPRASKSIGPCELFPEVRPPHTHTHIRTPFD